ncbi:hypothetical protein NPIL_176851, partial [Nephila pilipes]
MNTEATAKANITKSMKSGSSYPVSRKPNKKNFGGKLA